MQEALVISGEIPLWLVDGDDRIAFVNDAAVRALRYDSDEELLGLSSHDAVHYLHTDGSPYPAEDCPITHATRRGEPIRIERDWWVRKDGSLVPISIHCVPLEIDGRMGTAMTFHDLTASVQAEDDRRRLAVEQARLGEVRASRARIVAAADETRRRIERDLHDGIQQRLVSLSIQMRAAQTLVAPSQSELRDELASLVGAMMDALEELRELSHGIHPSNLTAAGLEPALQVLRRRSPLPVQLRLQLSRRLPEHVEVAAYYVVSEALTNAAKHSQASLVKVELDMDGDTARLVILDDGVGGANFRLGTGLVGLSDRIETLGGTLTVVSPAGQGTSIRAEFPLASPATAKDLAGMPGS